MKQNIICGQGLGLKLENLLTQYDCHKFLLVCDSSFDFLSIKESITSCLIPYVIFDKFTPNPFYEDVCKGVTLFNQEDCDAIVAVGGGSSLDVAKCIKLYAKMDPNKNYLEQEYQDSEIPLIAIPTTAGTGSESTRYAVIYYEGKKQSVTHDSIIPNVAVLDYTVLKTLPLYQKKCTMLDALCQGIESWWSVNSTEESRIYSEKAVRMIMEHYRSYIFENDEKAAEQIMLAANYSGRAINITQTTAAHAMSYKLTSLYKLSHGHAVSICLPRIWEYMQNNPTACIDPRGYVYVKMIFDEISNAIGTKSVDEAILRFDELISELEIELPVSDNRELDLRLLTESVNPVRLKNNPTVLTENVIRELYSNIVS